MEKELLEVLKQRLLALGINYEYGEYSGELVYPYVVGEYNENLYTAENGTTQGEVILTAFTTGTESDLIDLKDLIKREFADYRATTESGAVVFSYRGKLFIRENNLKKMEMYIDTFC